jgi:hypothetical protein
LSETNADYGFVWAAVSLCLIHARRGNRVDFTGRRALWPTKISPWTDQHWQAPPLAAPVVCEIHTGTFASKGIFDAAIDKLDHLVDLGYFTCRVDAGG